MPIQKRVLPEATQAVYQSQPAVGRFHRALRREDQYALEELIDYAHKHQAAALAAARKVYAADNAISAVSMDIAGVADAADAPQAAPEIETILLAMLLEQYKHVQRLNHRLERLLRAQEK